MSIEESNVKLSGEPKAIFVWKLEVSTNASEAVTIYIQVGIDAEVIVTAPFTSQSEETEVMVISSLVPTIAFLVFISIILKRTND
jgi:hypothetical protein